LYTLNLKSSNSNIEKFCKYAVCLFPIFFIILLVSHKFLFGALNDDYVNFAKEDGPVEYLTSIFFFTSFVLSIIIARKLIKIKKNFFALFYFLFTGIFLFAGLEEISWGQRIFLWESTEFFLENLQNETNLHNFPLMSSNMAKFYLAVGFSGAFLWAIIPNFKSKKYKSFKKFFVPGRFLMLYFLPIFLYFGMWAIKDILPTSSTGLVFNFFKWPDHEIVELLLSAGIFLFFLSLIQRFNKS